MRDRLALVFLSRGSVVFEVLYLTRSEISRSSLRRCKWLRLQFPLSFLAKFFARDPVPVCFCGSTD
ncbi:hypothetical protein F2Q69_00032353 [Brassica cretica]|uniref:Uncharacterized protein n=1 Tax=Brassica cretica TaxID=69181 RepID=A0A8S9RZX0_BRACR|nr:hypothetical protein F2Q69_00032353 [Brassica cretica]